MLSTIMHDVDFVISPIENVPKYVLNTIAATTTELLPTTDMSTSRETSTQIEIFMSNILFNVLKRTQSEIL